MAQIQMDTFTATMIAEGVQEASYEESILAWQRLVDTGVAWQLQGWFGRRANEMITAGVLHAPR